MRLVQRVLVLALLVAEFDERFHIVDALEAGSEQLRLRGGQPAGDLLGVFRVIPQARGRGLRFEILDIGLERSTSNALAMDSYLAPRLRRSPG